MATTRSSGWSSGSGLPDQVGEGGLVEEAIDFSAELLPARVRRTGIGVGAGFPPEQTVTLGEAGFQRDDDPGQLDRHRVRCESKSPLWTPLGDQDAIACELVEGLREVVSGHTEYLGDLSDRNSEVRELLRSHYTIRRKPELGTGPNVYYIV